MTLPLTDILETVPEERSLSIDSLVPGPAAWQSETDWPLRDKMTEEISNFLETKVVMRKPEFSLDSIPTVASGMEKHLYRLASSLEEYLDMTTLPSRIDKLIQTRRRVHVAHTNRKWIKERAVEIRRGGEQLARGVQNNMSMDVDNDAERNQESEMILQLIRAESLRQTEQLRGAEIMSSSPRPPLTYHMVAGHAVKCNDSNCTQQYCAIVKDLLWHHQHCSESACSKCSRATTMLSIHGRNCLDSSCTVPGCASRQSDRDYFTKHIQELRDRADHYEKEGIHYKHEASQAMEE